MWDELKQSFPSFLDNVFAFTAELQLNTQDLEIDHIAARYKEVLSVELLIKELKNEGRIISDVIVNGRPIYIFKLYEPLVYKNFRIPCVELPYPSADHGYPHDGWEHIEFVVPSSRLNFEEVFAAKFPQITDTLKKQHAYKYATPDVRGEKIANGTVALGKYKGLTVKFHAHSIEEIVST